MRTEAKSQPILVKRYTPPRWANRAQLFCRRCHPTVDLLLHGLQRSGARHFTSPDDDGPLALAAQEHANAAYPSVGPRVLRSSRRGALSLDKAMPVILTRR